MTECDGPINSVGGLPSAYLLRTVVRPPPGPAPDLHAADGAVMCISPRRGAAVDRGRVGQSGDLPTGQTGFLRLPASLPRRDVLPIWLPPAHSQPKVHAGPGATGCLSCKNAKNPSQATPGAIALHASTQRKPLASGYNKASPGRWQDHLPVTVTNRGGSKPLTC